MTTNGWIFFALSWTALITLNICCFRKVLADHRKKKNS